MRREQLAIRAAGFAVLLGAAVVLSGCVTTVDGRAAVGSTIAPISAATTTTSDSTSSTVPAPDPMSATPTTTSSDASTGLPDDAPVGLAIGDAITSTYEDGEADIWVRQAVFEGTGPDTVLRVTVDYECYEGEFQYDLADWTVLDSTGERSSPTPESAFGEADEQKTSAEFGIVGEWKQKRGHLVFDVAPGAATVEFGHAWGDPATWLTSEA